MRLKTLTLKMKISSFAVGIMPNSNSNLMQKPAKFSTCWNTLVNGCIIEIWKDKNRVGLAQSWTVMASPTMRSQWRETLDTGGIFLPVVLKIEISYCGVSDNCNVVCSPVVGQQGYNCQKRSMDCKHPSTMSQFLARLTLLTAILKCEK